MKTSSRTPLLYGPTASGKTALALSWSSQAHGNIISADARQVYTDMNIVVGKDLPDGSIWHESENGRPAGFLLPNGQWMFGLNLCPPTQTFTLSHWFTWVQPVIQCHQEKNIPFIVVGGTWQWLEVLFHPPKSLFVPPDEAWRRTAETMTVPELQARVQEVASERWESFTASDRANPRRLIRAIEVAQAPDGIIPKPLLEINQVEIWLRNATMDELTAAIQARVLERWSNGAVEETKMLLSTYQDWNTPAFSASGYPAIRAHLEKRVSGENTIQKWIWAERQYAKRQRTWIKKIQTDFASSITLV